MTTLQGGGGVRMWDKTLEFSVTCAEPQSSSPLYHSWRKEFKQWDPLGDAQAGHSVHIGSTALCPGPAQLLSQEPIPLLSLSEASRIHYHTNGGRAPLDLRVLSVQGLPGAWRRGRPLEQAAFSASVQMGQALCSARPGGCYGKQPTCLCHREHGRAIVCF